METGLMNSVFVVLRVESDWEGTFTDISGIFADETKAKTEAIRRELDENDKYVSYDVEEWGVTP